MSQMLEGIGIPKQQQAAFARHVLKRPAAVLASLSEADAKAVWRAAGRVSAPLMKP